jgi:hypothetical protein
MISLILILLALVGATLYLSFAVIINAPVVQWPWFVFGAMVLVALAIP